MSRDSTEYLIYRILFGDTGRIMQIMFLENRGGPKVVKSAVAAATLEGPDMSPLATLSIPSPGSR